MKVKTAYKNETGGQNYEEQRKKSSSFIGGIFIGSR